MHGRLFPAVGSVVALGLTMAACSLGALEALPEQDGLDRELFHDAQPARLLRAGAPTGKDWIYLDDWLVIGPFQSDFRQVVSPQVYEPFLPTVHLRPMERCRGKDDKTLAWEPWLDQRRSRIEPAWAPRGACYYAWTRVHVEEACRRWLAWGADDYGQLWINGRLVQQDPGPGGRLRTYRPDEAVFEVDWQAGWNEVLVRCQNNGGTMGWSVMVDGPKRQLERVARLEFFGSHISDVHWMGHEVPKRIVDRRKFDLDAEIADVFTDEGKTVENVHLLMQDRTLWHQVCAVQQAAHGHGPVRWSSDGPALGRVDEGDWVGILVEALPGDQRCFVLLEGTDERVQRLRFCGEDWRSVLAAMRDLPEAPHQLVVFASPRMAVEVVQPLLTFGLDRRDCRVDCRALISGDPLLDAPAIAQPLPLAVWLAECRRRLDDYAAVIDFVQQCSATSEDQLAGLRNHGYVEKLLEACGIPQSKATAAVDEAAESAAGKGLEELSAEERALLQRWQELDGRAEAVATRFASVQAALQAEVGPAEARRMIADGTSPGMPERTLLTWARLQRQGVRKESTARYARQRRCLQGLVQESLRLRSVRLQRLVADAETAR